MLGVVRAADGWVGINCLTGQHWLDVCAMLGLPEFGEQQIAIMLGGPERAEFFGKAQPLLAEQTVAEIVELGQAMRIPAAPVNDGATVAGLSAVRQARILRHSRRARTGRFSAPDPPFRFSKTAVAQPRPAPRLGARPEPWTTDARRFPRPTGRCPSAGLRVLDLTTFWAGRLPDLLPGRVRRRHRQGRVDPAARRAPLLGRFPFEGDDWYERSAIWQATNLNKRDLTLDLTSQRGLDIARRLAAQADVVVENFSPRVVEQFGLDYDSLVSLNPT